MRPDEVIGHIRESRFVIADMTYQKAGMYFEGGFAMGLGIPVVWTCRMDHMGKVHFDTSHYNHLAWKTTDELRVSSSAFVRPSVWRLGRRRPRHKWPSRRKGSAWP